MGSSSPVINQSALMNVDSRRGEPAFLCARKNQIMKLSLKDGRINSAEWPWEMDHFRLFFFSLVFHKITTLNQWLKLQFAQITLKMGHFFCSDGTQKI